MTVVVGTVKIDGIVDRITYRDDESLYSVIKIKGANGSQITAVGLFPSVVVGENLRLGGEWLFHKEYGKQFKVIEIEKLTPNTLLGLEKYLGSGLISGIGPVYAKKLVNAFGLDTLDVIENEPEKLLNVEGIGAKKSEKIIKSVKEHKAISKVMVFLQGNGVSPLFAVKIYKAYGDDALDIVGKNPYRLADDIFGVGFKTADRIAMNMGIERSSKERVKAGLRYMLSQNADNGHCYAEKAELFEQTMVELECDQSVIEESLLELASEQEVIIEDDSVYLAAFFFCEIGIARKIVKINEETLFTTEVFNDESLRNIQEEMKIELGEKQLEAVKSAFDAGMFILTGGPGTGKTTTVRAIIAMFESVGKKVVLAAPTGRAAKKLSEASRKEAKTIHRLLEFEPSHEGWGFKRNAENPLKCDVLIVDEVSMVDVVLMHNLLKAVKNETRVIFVGDVDQLPSVGPGNVLKDMIASNVIKYVALDTVFRQAAHSNIVTNAHRINRGEFPYIPEKSRDFFFVQEEDPELVVSKIKHIISGTLRDRFHLDPVDDIQVLSPMKRTITGVDNLNLVLKETLNPAGHRVPEMKFAGTSFRLNDKVMQIKNNYDKMVWNGDSGRIVNIDNEEGTLVVRYPEAYADRDVLYETSDLDELTMSYCVSIHKSQGSEYKAVVVPITTQHYIMLQRNLIYTAITRAKKVVILVGTKKALAMAIRNSKVALRKTKLKERLCELFEKI